MTWGEIKLITLQKVFAISDGKMRDDSTTKEYITAMPGAANEGLQRLATVGRFLKKNLELIQDGRGTGVAKYDLRALAGDFYSLSDDGIYFTGGGDYYKATDWTLEAGQMLVLPAEVDGVWSVWYNAYPEHITADTKADDILPLYHEMAVLLPLYMASQLYKDDDISVATQYRNEFEVGMDGLIAARQQGGSGGGGRWRSTTGWW